jgi:hypothetical protein
VIGDRTRRAPLLSAVVIIVREDVNPVARFILGSGDHAREERNQFFPERLMKVVCERAAQITIIAGRKRGCNRTCICTVLHGSRPPYL